MLLNQVVYFRTSFYLIYQCIWHSWLCFSTWNISSLGFHGTTCPCFLLIYSSLLAFFCWCFLISWPFGVLHGSVFESLPCSMDTHSWTNMSLNTIKIIIIKLISPGQTSSLNSRLLYPTSYLTEPIRCHVQTKLLVYSKCHPVKKLL